MSAAFFIVLDKNNPGFDSFVNGKFLAQESKRLEKISKKLNIRRLEDYVSCSPDAAREMMEDLGADPEDFDGLDLPEQQWFDAQEGLTLVAKLSEYIQATPTAVKNSTGVLADLQEFKQVLENAKAVGARWNLQVDF